MGIIDRVNTWIGRNKGGIAEKNWGYINKYVTDNKFTKKINIYNDSTDLTGSLYFAFYEVDNFPQIIKGVKHYKFGIRINANCLGTDVDIPKKFDNFVNNCIINRTKIFYKKSDNAWGFSFGTALELCKDADLLYNGLFFVTSNDNKVYLIKYE